jgi:hypothetical protein
MPRDRFGAWNIGTFARQTFPRKTKASKRAKVIAKFVSFGLQIKD